MDVMVKFCNEITGSMHLFKGTENRFILNPHKEGILISNERKTIEKVLFFKFER